jgi:hypothetical protein
MGGIGVAAGGTAWWRLDIEQMYAPTVGGAARDGNGIVPQVRDSCLSLSWRAHTRIGVARPIAPLP